MECPPRKNLYTKTNHEIREITMASYVGQCSLTATAAKDSTASHPSADANVFIRRAAYLFLLRL